MRLAAGLLRGRALLGVFSFHKRFQIAEAGRPEAAVLLEPGIHGFQRFGVELVKTVAAFAMFVDQVRATQQTQMFRNRRPGDGEGRAICPAGWRPLRSRSSTARRVGSARALNVASGEYVTDWFRIMRNCTVT